MNTFRMASALSLGVLGLCLGGAAAADRGHGHGYHGHSHIGVGVVVNPFWLDTWPYPRPYYYPPYPYYYPPSVVTVPAAPSTYIERDDGPAPQTSAYWYYCSQPAGYYPYVKQCPGGWQPVTPQPPPPDEER